MGDSDCAMVTATEMVEEERDGDNDQQQFQCGICRELCFKPIVHACGHLFCFWCVHSAMNLYGTSLCPMCRSPYNQFPRICELLHRLLGAAFREEYQRRRRDIQQTETAAEVFSPEKLLEKKSDEDVTTSDLTCELCKKLLYRPVVLNCGHAFCQSCLPVPDEGQKLSCMSCKMLQKTVPVRVCLELNEYIHKTFRLEFKKREDELKALGLLESSSVPSTSSCSDSVKKEGSEDAGDNGLVLVHFGVGCDGCGVYPIIGSRFKCQDCPEKIGFDLCGECFAISAVPVGRFNQRHTADHRMTRMTRTTQIVPEFHESYPATS